MESQGIIEFRYPDGRAVRGDYRQFANSRPNESDTLEFRDLIWALHNRETENGTTVFVFRPLGEAELLVVEMSRRRDHSRHH